MIDLDLNFIVDNKLDITWNRNGDMIRVVYSYLIDEKKNKTIAQLFHSKRIGNEPQMNTMLRALREAYDFIEGRKNG